MVLDLDGFRMLENVANFGSTRIIRMIRESDQARVLAKTTSDEVPRTRLVRGMKREFDLLKQLKGRGAVEPYEFRVVNGRPIMLFDDAPGRTMEHLLADRRQRPGLNELLTIAASAAYAVHELHGLKRFHGMITPRHFIIHPETGEARLLDLGNGGGLGAVSMKKLPNAFLSYLPEQAMDEMRGKLGFQSDLYSLGVTLYHWFEGSLPLPGDPRLEHQDTQEKPKVVKSFFATKWLPEMISIIASKCTQLTPTPGYSSVGGVYKDLMQCLRQLEQKGDIELFRPALDDNPVPPELSGHLYGRDAEQKQLREAYQSSANGSFEMVWLSGGGGIGKSTFVEQTMEKLMPDGSIFVSVKFDEGHNTAPYEVWSHIFTQLTDYLLTASTMDIDIWKLRILEAVEGHGGLLLDLAPHLSGLIGEQPSVPKLASSMAHHRLYSVMDRFLELFGQFEMPLVLFFDDLQWGDDASLHYLHHMLTYEGKFKHTMVLCAFRNTVWGPLHPMSKMEAELNERSKQITNIQLSELNGDDLQDMLEDTLDLSQGQLGPFAAELLRKTGGHPLFLRRFFQQLLNDGLLLFNGASKRWHCDLERVKGLRLAEDVADYLSDRLTRLPQQTKLALSQAAHLGRIFTLDRAAVLLAWLPEQLEEALQTAEKEGLIQRHLTSGVENAYVFLHDRIRQTATELVGENERLLQLADIGWMLVEKMPEDGDRYLFEAVSYLNQAAITINEPLLKQKLKKLNMQAGQKAKQATAYESSLDYFLRAASFVLEHDWEEHYPSTFQLYQELAEAAHYSTRFELANETCQLLLTRSRSDWDRAVVYRMLIQHEVSQNHHEEVLRLARQALQLLGIKDMFKPSWMGIAKKWITCRRKLRRYSPTSIIDLAPMTDERQKAIMTVLAHASNACFYLNKAGWIAVTITMLEMTIDNGLAPESSIAFVGYAMILSLQFRRHLEATEWGGAALLVAKPYPHLFVKTLTAYSLCYDSWRQYDANFMDKFTEHAGKVGLESGDLWQSNQSVMLHNVLMMQFGQPLPDIYKRLQARSHDFARHNVRDFWFQVSMLSEFAVRLTGYQSSNDIYHRFDQEYMDREVQKAVDARNETSSDAGLWTFGLIQSYIFGDYERAEYCIERIRQHVKYHQDAFLEPSALHFYEALTLLAQYDDVDKTLRRQYVRRIRQLMRKLHRFARRCPINYMDKFMLVRAEWLRVTGQTRKAGEMYRQSIETSRFYKHYHNWGIAAECYTRFALKEKQYSRAGQYIREAYEAYGMWGAAVKQAQLASLYRELLGDSYDAGNKQLDERFVLRALHSLSVEMEMSGLLQTLLRITLQSTGAEFGALLMDSDSGWKVEAYGTKEEIGLNEIPMEEADQLIPAQIVGYVIRTRETVVLEDAAEVGMFSRVQLVREKQIKSVLCMPIIHQQKLLCVLYLDNRQISGLFTPQKLDVLKLLSEKCAVSLENAKLYSGIQALKDSLEMQVRERTVSLEQSMRETSAALAEMSVFAERNRIAQDIHDVVGHGLTSTILQIEAGKRLLHKEDREGALSRLQVAQDLIRHSLSEIRGSVHMLKTGNDFDIAEASRKLLTQTGLQVQVDISDIPDIPFIYKKVIYHALQEGITNGIRHGGSKGFVFSFTYDGSLLLFRLQDYGNGASEIRMGFGLTAMKERVEQHGGRLSVTSEPGEGCVLQISLPYQAEYGGRGGQ
ncbi:AAA family ATPase [Paenibacillus luteus]|uniref:AAA family ATPase n=1 Tax=Paenibacillus luteus TaxID=2545753 RepID=UPI0011422363|nr:AAA family ATPase [Paenibacillus luteus]